MIIKAVHIEAVTYPPCSLQDTPATKEEIANIRKFVDAIEEAAEKYLPMSRSNVKIHEERVTDVRCCGNRESDMSLRDRCKEFLRKSAMDGMLRQGSPVDNLIAFVQSELGRGADPRLEDTKSLILYFADEEGREEMKAALLDAKPGMYAKDIP